MTALRRLRDAWRALPAEHRLCGAAALFLLATMILPWYSTSRGVPVPGRGAQLVEDSQTALQAFSFVEAAVLLVALGVLALLFARGERRAFHLPGGDGVVIAGAGVWAALLIVWRLFDKPELGRGVSVGLAWGIFVALTAAALLVVAGNRLRAARRPEPPLQRARPPAPPDEPVEFQIPEKRPHLDETQVIGERQPGLSPLSREAATRDTAEFRAAEEPTEKLPDPLPGDQSSNSA
ncbi:MAG TPA: hypothetical protein VNB64_03090 [Solirubrobacteraceae bacterium]|nr:hypothetical protein [Solirubrobacteraceae bacterium]